MWVVSPLTGWRSSSLTTTGVAAAPVDLEVDHRAAVGERLAQLARLDLEGDRILAAAVDDAGDVARRGAAGARRGSPRARARRP